MPTRSLANSLTSPPLQALFGLLHVIGRIVRPGDYLLDESRNHLADELGNRLTA